MITFAGLFCIGTALGRTCLGLDTAQAKRYIPLIIPIYVAIYFYILTLTLNVKNILLSVFLMVSTFTYIKSVNHKEAEYYYNNKTAWKQCYLNNFNVDYCNQVIGFKPHPSNERMEKVMLFLNKNKLNIFRVYD